MKMNSIRVPVLAVAALVVLGIAFTSSPLMPTVRDAVGEIWDLSLGGPRGAQAFHLVESAGAAGLLLNGEARRYELFDSNTIAAIHEELSPRVPFHAAIARTAEKHGVDSRLLAAVVEAESNFDPSVVSPRGAVGLTQVLPATGGADSAMDLHDPATNLDAGARYLSQLMVRYDGDVELALAAYNAGPGRVDRFGGVPPFSETRAYVRKVMELYEQHREGGWRN